MMLSTVVDEMESMCDRQGVDFSSLTFPRKIFREKIVFELNESCIRVIHYDGAV